MSVISKLLKESPISKKKVVVRKLSLQSLSVGIKLSFRTVFF